jgi:hypothetical protein
VTLDNIDHMCFLSLVHILACNDERLVPNLSIDDRNLVITTPRLRWLPTCATENTIKNKKERN